MTGVELHGGWLRRRPMRKGIAVGNLDDLCKRPTHHRRGPTIRHSTTRSCKQRLARETMTSAGGRNGNNAVQIADIPNFSETTPGPTVMGK